MEQLAPILAHPDNSVLLEEWFAANPESVSKWRHWFEVGKLMWREFAQNKWALTEWIPSLLVQSESSRPVWPRKLYFDLGVRVSPVEILLIKELSQVQDVEVLMPDPAWASAFSSTMHPYRLLDERPDTERPKASLSQLSTFSSHPRYRRFSTHLAEIKEATSRIRGWLDEGVAPSKIAVVTPDMEVYGASLRLYLDVEGVPLQKSGAEPLHSHPDIARWLAEIRIKINRFNRKDLELHLFQDAAADHIPYSEFRRLFGRFYDAGDVARWPELEKKLSIKEGVRCSQKEFLDWSLRLCPNKADLEKVAMLVAEFSRDGSLDLSLSAEVWAGMLEDLAARVNLNPVQNDSEGIYI